jgi:predicted GIY-YIG superfamily endonuclease
MLLRDRIRARLTDMGDCPDYVRVAADVLGISNVPPDLARRLVSQALVIEDPRDRWRRLGERICASAPAAPGVYVLRDAERRAVYVGKAIDLRRRLRTHFAERRWRALKPHFARIVDAEWQEVGSELEALLREAALIDELHPIVNVQTAPPALATRRIPCALVRDVLVVVRSIDEASAELVAARADGGWLVQRTRRDGANLAADSRRLLRFFNSPLRARFDGRPLAPLVFSWLAGRGARASRLDPHDASSPGELAARLATLLADERVFTERIVVR